MYQWESLLPFITESHKKAAIAGPLMKFHASKQPHNDSIAQQQCKSIFCKLNETKEENIPAPEYSAIHRKKKYTFDFCFLSKVSILLMINLLIFTFQTSGLRQSETSAGYRFNGK